MNRRDSAIEEVDVSNTLINYTGLENLGTYHFIHVWGVGICIYFTMQVQ